MAYRPLQDHILYHFKVVLTGDVQELMSSLVNSGIIEPDMPNEGQELPPELERALEQYHRTVAQAVYRLPSVWPTDEDFCLIINASNNLNLSQVSGVSTFFCFVWMMFTIVCIE
jgi:hypothetical protein